MGCVGVKIITLFNSSLPISWFFLEPSQYVNMNLFYTVCRTGSYLWYHAFSDLHATARLRSGENGRSFIWISIITIINFLASVIDSSSDQSVLLRSRTSQLASKRSRACPTGTSLLQIQKKHWLFLHLHERSHSKSAEWHLQKSAFLFRAWTGQTRWYLILNFLFLNLTVMSGTPFLAFCLLCLLSVCSACYISNCPVGGKRALPDFPLRQVAIYFIHVLFYILYLSWRKWLLHVYFSSQHVGNSSHLKNCCYFIEYLLSNTLYPIAWSQVF